MDVLKFRLTLVSTISRIKKALHLGHLAFFAETLSPLRYQRINIAKGREDNQCDIRSFNISGIFMPFYDETYILIYGGKTAGIISFCKPHDLLFAGCEGSREQLSGFDGVKESMLSNSCVITTI